MVVGRGTRWPGWYIIAYLSARNVYFTAKDDPVGAFTVKEDFFVLVPIWPTFTLAVRVARPTRHDGRNPSRT